MGSVNARFFSVETKGKTWRETGTNLLQHDIEGVGLEIGQIQTDPGSVHEGQISAKFRILEVSGRSRRFSNVRPRHQ